MNLRKAVALCLIAAMLLLSGCAGEQSKEPQERNIVLEDIHIRVENISPYDGIYIEQGDDENKDRVEGVCALSFTNTAQKTILDAHFVFTDGKQELNFYLQMLPHGSTVTVVEYDKKAMKSGELSLVDSEINYLQTAMEDMESFELIHSEYGSFIVENLTQQNLSRVEVYYRRAYGDGTLGGLCYVEVLEDVGIGEIVFADPYYWSDKCAIVNILLYPGESEAADETQGGNWGAATDGTD